MVRVGMGLIKNEHGVHHVRRKVPKRLEEATARVTGAPKVRQPWLKRSLRTKDEKRARVLSKPVMIEFDRILAKAEALVAEHPVRTELTKAEIKQITDYFYAYELRADEDLRVSTLYQSSHRRLLQINVLRDRADDVLLAYSCRRGSSSRNGICRMGLTAILGPPACTMGSLLRGRPFRRCR
jgi:hypothetical protein